MKSILNKDDGDTTTSSSSCSSSSSTRRISRTPSLAGSITKMKKNKNKNNKKVVRWSDLTIYEFPVGLGDNPAVSSGCPIALDGLYYCCKKVYNLDVLDQFRTQTQAPPPRTIKELKIHPKIRDMYLTNVLGYSSNELTGVVKECEKIRRSRRLSMSDFEDDLDVVVDNDNNNANDDDCDQEETKDNKENDDYDNETRMNDSNNSQVLLLSPKKLSPKKSFSLRPIDLSNLKLPKSPLKRSNKKKVMPLANLNNQNKISIDINNNDINNVNKKGKKNNDKYIHDENNENNTNKKSSGSNNNNDKNEKDTSSSSKSFVNNINTNDNISNNKKNNNNMIVTINNNSIIEPERIRAQIMNDSNSLKEIMW